MRQTKYGNVTASVRWGERSPLKERISLLSRLGVSTIWLGSYDIHPSRDRKRIAEVGKRVRDAGLDVSLYFVGHEVGRSSPDSLPFKIEAAKTLGAKALCLRCPTDAALKRTSGADDPYGDHRDDLHIEEYLMADWDDARLRLRDAGLGIRFIHCSPSHWDDRKNENTLRRLLDSDEGDDLGLVWYSDEHISDLYYATPDFVKEFGHRIYEFSFSFESGARWFDHGEYSYYGKPYPGFTVEQKKGMCIDEFRKSWRPVLKELSARAVGSVEFRIGKREGEDEGFLVQQLDELSRALAERGNEGVKKVTRKPARMQGKRAVREEKGGKK